MALQIREELEKLLKIQELDIRIQDARKTLKVAPLFIQPLQAELKKIEEKILKSEGSIADLEKKILDLENAVKSDAIYADSMELKLPTLLERHKEYHLTAKNIDKLRKLGRDRVVEIKSLNERKLEAENLLSELLEKKEELTTQLRMQILNVEIQISEAKEEMSQAQSQRERLSQAQAPHLLLKYERFSQAYGHGIGIVQDKRCLSCFVALPPQTLNLLQKGEEILHCPSCQRMLYLKAQ